MKPSASSTVAGGSKLKSETVQASSEVGRRSDKKGILKILPVTLYGNKKKVETYAALDSCSTSTLLEESVANQLNLKGSLDLLLMKGVRNCTSVDDESRRVSVRISGIGSDRVYKIYDVRTVDDIGVSPLTLKASNLQKSFHHLKSIPLYDLENAKLQILFGIEHPSLLVEQDYKEGKFNEPIASLTRLGWVISGKVPIKKTKKYYENVMTICECRDPQLFNGSIHSMVQRFFTTQDVGVKLPDYNAESRDEKRGRAILESTLKYIHTDNKSVYCGRKEISSSRTIT
jgi:hypothetical protein